MNPRPTEYKKIRFKSKTEAQVAMMLDIHMRSHNDNETAWLKSCSIWYEPDWLRLPDGYCPDFLVQDIWYETLNDSNFSSVTNWIVVECKPSKTTETYRDELHNRFMDIWRLPFIQANRFAAGGIFSFLLLEGNFYKGDRTTWTWTGSSSRDRVPDIVDWPFDEALTEFWPDDENWPSVKEVIFNHRFDLE